MNITHSFDRAVATTWQWRDRMGERHYPRDMETRHAFHVLRMVWNNRMPAHMRVGRNPRLYSFNSHYPDSYLGEAVVQMARELTRRDDLTHEQKEELDEMRRWFLDPQAQVKAQTLRIVHG